MTMRFDHILIRVDNLNETVHEFQEMGFKVYYGNGKRKCHHAMIYFQDDSFIEFIDQNAFPRILRLLAERKILNLFGPFFKRVGFYSSSPNRFLDYSLYSNEISVLYKQVKTKNRVSKLMNLKRINHLNEKIEWRLFGFDDMELPFIMSDYYPKKYPEANCFHHFNGINGIKNIQISSTSVNGLIQKFDELFNLKNSTHGIIKLENTQLEFKQSDKFEIVSITLQPSELQTDNFNYSNLNKYSIKYDDE